MYAAKKEDGADKLIVDEEWRWTHPTYVLQLKTKLTDYKKVEIDPSQRMADVDRKNNLIEFNW